MKTINANYMAHHCRLHGSGSSNSIISAYGYPEQVMKPAEATLWRGSALKGMALGPTRSKRLAASPLTRPLAACSFPEAASVSNPLQTHCTCISAACRALHKNSGQEMFQHQNAWLSNELPHSRISMRDRWAMSFCSRINRKADRGKLKIV